MADQIQISSEDAPVKDQKGKILVTGGTGFIGTFLVKILVAQGYCVRVTGLFPSEELEALGVEFISMGDLANNQDWSPALAGIHAVVHLAGLAHKIGPDTEQSTDLFDKVNHQATASLVTALGHNPTIGRFIFISSVSVYGEHPNLPLTENTPPNPHTPYGLSKLKAEEVIARQLPKSLVKWAIFRPVLVYGPGHPGNMARLEKLIRRRTPVPVRRRSNKRSFLFVGNLASAILAYLQSEAPPTARTWLIADPTTCSTAELVQWIGTAMHLPGKTLPLPEWFIRHSRTAGDLLRRMGIPFPWNSATVQKLLGDFYVDSSLLQQELNWKPAWSTQEGIIQTYEKNLFSPKTTKQTSYAP